MNRYQPPDGRDEIDLFGYRKASGELVIYVRRFDYADGDKRFMQYGPTADGRGWQPNLEHAPKPRPPYDLPEILGQPDAMVVVHEGEKAVVAAKLASLPGVHTTTLGGASNARHTDFSWAAGRSIVISPDRDEAGEQYARDVARLASDAGAARVAIARLPDLPPKGDVVEWLAADGNPARFSELVQGADVWSSHHTAVETRQIDPRARIDAIRLDSDLRAFQKRRAIADVVLEGLQRRGWLIRTAEDELFYFDSEKKRLDPLEGDSFRARLYDEFGLNPSEHDTRYVERDLWTAGMRHGEQAAVHRLAYWNATDQRLYVSGNDGSMYVLDGETVTVADNGTSGVLFLTDRYAEPFVLEDQATEDEFHRLFENLSLDGDDATKKQSLAIFKVWALSVFFRAALPVRPILTLIGPQDSGKTTLGRRWGLVLYGRRFQVGSFRSDARGEQDFLAAVTARTLVVFDNADERLPWLPDHLARLATGAEIEMRKLYTTNSLVSYRPDCLLVMTTMHPVWKRDDVVRRLLPIRMQPIGTQHVPEGRLQGDVLKQRNHIWAGIFSVLNSVIKELKLDNVRFTSQHRLADFHCVGQAIARALGISEEFDAGMKSLEDAQLHLLGEGDERLDLLQTWCGQAAMPDRTISTRDLLSELKDRHSGPDRSFPFRSATSLGSWLGRHRALLRHHGIDLQELELPKGRAWRFCAARCDAAVIQNSAESQVLTSGRTVAPSEEEPFEIGAQEEIYTGLDDKPTTADS